MIVWGDLYDGLFVITIVILVYSGGIVLLSDFRAFYFTDNEHILKMIQKKVIR